jgi:uncharacterized protein (TIGR03435 family)
MQRVCFLVVLPVFLAAQPAATPVFEVADVHVSTDPSTPFMDIGFVASRYEIRHATLVDLIYGVDAEIVSGGPAWPGKKRFDIIAKLSPRVPETERNQMLQSLLSDRFKLTLHKDNRPTDVFVLTVGKRVQLKLFGRRRPVGLHGIRQTENLRFGDRSC